MAKPISHQNEFDPFSRIAAHGRDIERLKRRAVGPWHTVGDDTDEAAASYKNGWGAPTDSSMQPMRYRFLVGGGIQLEGSAAGGSVGSVIFTLPLVFRPDKTLRPVGSDDDGNPIVFEIRANGDVLRLS